MTLPAAIDVRITPTGKRWCLPPFPLGPFRWFGVLPLIVGLVFFGVPLASVASFFTGGSLAVKIFGLLIALAFAATSLPLLRLGVLCLFGHSVIELHRDQVVGEFRAGPVYRRRRCPLGDTAAFEVKSSTQAGSSRLHELAGLYVASGGQRQLIAAAYPRDWMTALADALSDEVRHAGVAAEVEQIAIDAGLPDEGKLIVSAPMPAETDLSLERRDDGLTLVVPPAGIRGAARAMLIFAIFWCGFMVLFTSFFVGFMVMASSSSSSSSGMPIIGRVLFIGFIFAFWGIGLSMLAGSMNMARRHAVLDVAYDTLVVNRKTLFGLKQNEWPLADLESIKFGPSGMAINDKPVHCLLIKEREGKVTKLFSSRTDPELRWMAAVLAERLPSGD